MNNMSHLPETQQIASPIMAGGNLESTPNDAILCEKKGRLEALFCF
jgi:hypothetical protein